MLLDYRKDIDGLRAIAVMLVVLYHAKLPVSGGYVGVDVFFVISGFLIASLIQKQILRDKFTFKGFYLHRMRRILPVLLTVIFATVAASWFIVMPQDFLFLGRSIIFSLLSVSNFFFLSKTSQYFAQDAEQTQLIHTWSLSVEEQFYFIAPIFLILLFKFFYKTKWFNYILIGLLITTFVISQTMATYSPAAAYYLLPSRFFELFMGVTLALNYQNIPTFKNKQINNIISVCALLLILCPAFLLTKESLFPGINAFYVCFGAALLIYLGKLEEKTIITKMLSVKPLMWIGLISYSLYLWHWVVFSTFNLIGLQLSVFAALAVIIGLIEVSFLSWKFIEQPFRHKFKWSFRKTTIALFVLPLVFAIGFKNIVKKEEWLTKLRFSPEIQKHLKDYQISKEDRQKYCHNAIFEGRTQNKENCTIGKNNKNPKVLFYGDSHANSAEGFMEILLKDAGLSAYAMTNNSSTYFINYNIKQITKDEKHSEEDVYRFFNILESEIKNVKYDYIVFTGRYSFYEKSYGKKQFYKMFIDTIDMLTKTGAIPVVITDIPELEETYYCSTYNKLLNLNKKCRLSYDKYLEKTKSIREIYKGIEQKFPNAIIIDQNKIICDSDFCRIQINGKGMYFDDNHITVRSSRILGEKYLEKFGNPFTQK